MPTYIDRPISTRALGQAVAGISDPLSFAACDRCRCAIMTEIDRVDQAPT
jgi:hypothetical protein